MLNRTLFDASYERRRGETDEEFRARKEADWDLANSALLVTPAPISYEAAPQDCTPSHARRNRLAFRTAGKSAHPPAAEDAGEGWHILLGSRSVSPTRRTPRTALAHTPAPEPIPSREPSEIEAPDTPDTAPSVTNSVTNAALLTDDQLRPFYNEWMRRKMKARRT